MKEVMAQFTVSMEINGDLRASIQLARRKVGFLLLKLLVVKVHGIMIAPTGQTTFYLTLVMKKRRGHSTFRQIKLNWYFLAMAATTNILNTLIITTNHCLDCSLLNAAAVLVALHG